MTSLTPALRAKARAVKLVVFDVDGVLTDGKLWYSSNGEELKAFHVQDGSALKLLPQQGIDVAIITGRQSPMVARRAAELGISRVYQGSELHTSGGQPATGKLPQYQELLADMCLEDAQVACVGDDIADLPLLKRCGLGISVPNGHPTAQQAASLVTATAGGDGVAREVAEFLLRAQDRWPY